VNVKDLKEVASDQTYDTLSKIIEAQEDPEIKKQMRIKEIGVLLTLSIIGLLLLGTVGPAVAVQLVGSNSNNDL